MQLVTKIPTIIALSLVTIITLSSSITFASESKQTLDELCNGSGKNSSLCDGYNKQNIDPTTGENGFLLSAIDILSFIAGVLAVIYAIYGGFLYILSSGDSAKVSQGKNAVFYALIGIVVVVIANQLVSYIVITLTN